MKQEQTISAGTACVCPLIEYHADDYGLFPAQSRRILDCAENGVLNAVSIMTTSPRLAVCMESFEPFLDKLDIAVHLNFMEGQALRPGLLTGKNGTFRVTFGSLLLHSFLLDRKKYRAALKEEIKSQLQAAEPYLSGKPLRIDSHAHYHMIPVVFDALMDVLTENKLPVSYIRIPMEPIGLYLRHWTELKGLRPINLVKVLVLNLLAARDLHKYRPFMETLEKRVFLGVMLSGRMSYPNVSALRKDAAALAERRGWGLEILAHPGGVYESDDLAELTHKDDAAFLSSRFRRDEAEMFQKVGSDI